MYDPASKNVFVFNARSHDATAVNAKTGEVAGTVPLGGKPEAAAADGAGHAWVNIEDKAQLVEFDSKEFKVLNTSASAELRGTDWNGDRYGPQAAVHRLPQQSDARDGLRGQSRRQRADRAGRGRRFLRSRNRLAFASCGDGTITVAHEDSPDKYTVVETISTQRGARTMALDTANHRVFTVTSDFGPPPAATADNPNPRPTQVPGTFTLLIYGR